MWQKIVYTELKGHVLLDFKHISFFYNHTIQSISQGFCVLCQHNLAHNYDMKQNDTGFSTCLQIKSEKCSMDLHSTLLLGYT